MKIPRDTLQLQVCLCGRGGQGVLFATRVLVETALEMGVPVLSSETHGMAMRGGSVVSHVRFGPFASPLIPPGQADLLLVLSRGEFDAGRHMCKRKTGCIYVNAPAAPSAGVYTVDADATAAAAGSILAANLVLLGFVCGHGHCPLECDRVAQVLERISPARFRELNLRALRAGQAAAGHQAP